MSDVGSLPEPFYTRSRGVGRPGRDRPRRPPCDHGSRSRRARRRAGRWARRRRPRGRGRARSTRARVALALRRRFESGPPKASVESAVPVLLRGAAEPHRSPCVFRHAHGRWQQRRAQAAPSGRSPPRRVEDRAGNAGRGDPVSHRPFVACESYAMQLDPLAPMSARPGSDVNRSAWPHDAPERSGAPVAEDRVVAVREHCRHPLTARAQGGSADRVDAAMDEVQTAGPEVPVDCSSIQPESLELPSRDTPC
jgi:hypothetical protein